METFKSLATLVKVEVWLLNFSNILITVYKDNFSSSWQKGLYSRKVFPQSLHLNLLAL